MGVANANYSLANTRLIMATMPALGRNHFFAYFTVVTSLGLGFSPILWGVGIDALRSLGPPARWAGMDARSPAACDSVDTRISSMTLLLIFYPAHPAKFFRQ